MLNMTNNYPHKNIVKLSINMSFGSVVVFQFCVTINFYFNSLRLPDFVILLYCVFNSTAADRFV